MGKPLDEAKKIGSTVLSSAINPLFGGSILESIGIDKKKKAVPPPKPVSEQEVSALEAEAEMKRRRKAQGKASTILTSSQGDTSQANLATTTLLGG